MPLLPRRGRTAARHPSRAAARLVPALAAAAALGAAVLPRAAAAQACPTGTLADIAANGISFQCAFGDVRIQAAVISFVRGTGVPDGATLDPARIFLTSLAGTDLRGRYIGFRLSGVGGAPLLSASATATLDAVSSGVLREEEIVLAMRAGTPGALDGLSVFRSEFRLAGIEVEANAPAGGAVSSAALRADLDAAPVGRSAALLLEQTGGENAPVLVAICTEDGDGVPLPTIPAGCTSYANAPLAPRIDGAANSIRATAAVDRGVIDPSDPGSTNARAVLGSYEMRLYVATVPEPGTVAMLGGGLALLGVAAARRRRG